MAIGGRSFLREQPQSISSRIRHKATIWAFGRELYGGGSFAGF